MNIDATGSGTMTLNITGGTLQTTGPQDFVGVDGQGAITQTSGTYKNGSLILASGPASAATYELGGNGTLEVTTFELIANSGTATFTQTGGTHTLGTNLSLGAQATGSGTYSLSGTGVLSATGRENVGLNGEGIFNQSGGTNTAGDTLYIARYAGSTGVYNLSGGTLNANNGIGNGVSNIGTLEPGGTGTFSYTGGLLNVGGAGILNAGQFTMSGVGTRIVNGDMTNLAGGSLNGNGTIDGNLDNDGGVIGPGLSPGKLTVTGDYMQTGGVLEVEIAGLGTGEFDILDVAGNAVFTGGEILFSFIDGFLPRQGDVVAFLLAQDVMGLDQIAYSYMGAPPGFRFDVAFENGAVVFEALNDAVPEPMTLALVGAGLALVGFQRRRQAAA